jgi:putative copper export protein
VTVAMIAVLAFGTNWRLALVAAMAAGAIMLTRLRYAQAVAVALLAITVVLAQTGHSAVSDHRDVVHARSSAR